MSTRDYKQFGTGEWYHVFTRGNDKMDIFRDEQDYFVFMHRLRAALGKETTVQGAPLHTLHIPRRDGRIQVRITPFEADAFSIAAYCLMPNHFHFLIRQNGEIPISTLLLKVLTSYSMYFNRKYQHVGHVFQDRFKAVHIDNDTQLKHVSAYIHVNPKIARLVRDLRKWKYSSYPEYFTDKNGGVCDTRIILEQFRNAREYEKFVEESFEDIRARKDAVRELMMDV
jgi:putative transposase